MWRFGLLIFLCYINHEVELALRVRKFVNQKEMSERCKRRVVPSLFLGKQVVEANSHVLHFSKLEIPYSCSISVRAENGYNIIMIIQLLPVYNLHEACSRNQDQLIVYELGETFGGYWGHLPDTVMNKTKSYYSTFYTIKATKSTTVTKRTRTYKEETEKILKQTFPATDKDPDYRMEVPLVNVSGNLQLGGPLRHTYNVEEMFDFIYDVTPRNGVEYRTSIMPLMQLSITQQGGRELYGNESRYKHDYGADSFFTFNRRSTLRTSKKRFLSRKNNWFQNRRYKFKKKDNTFMQRKNTTLKKYFSPWSAFLTSNNIKNTVIPTVNLKYTTVSWKYIDDIVKSYKASFVPSTKTQDMKMKNLLRKISDMQHNMSVYTVPNISIYAKNDHGIISAKSSFYTKPIINEFSRKIFEFLSRSITLHEFKTMTTISDFNGTLTTSLQFRSTNTNIVNVPIEPKKTFLLKNNKTRGDVIFNLTDFTALDNAVFTIEPIKTKEIKIDDATRVSVLNRSGVVNLVRNGTLVDHESWENVVQAAPVMAIILTKSEQNLNGFFNKTTQNHLNSALKLEKSKLRKKRHIKVLEIEKSRPRNMTTKSLMTTKTEPPFRFSDMQDLARLVELQDDEIEDRVALRYLRNYVGSALFNICDHETSLQMFLFNTSRIVIAISNFTLDRMTIVLTPALALQSNASQCPPEHLECQITGTRVCIDSMNACDGIPNCGSYEIYDEDRLVCGASGQQHDVYLAAIAFLAVLLTMLYTVHYWLKRCVPGVSEAFFIYSDASENTLNLDTIMRSPTEIDDASYKFVYPSHFFDDDVFNEHKELEVKDNMCTKIAKMCCRLLFCNKKKNKKQEITLEHDPKPSKMFSFTELELRKYILKDQAVQTSESIEDIQGIIMGKKRQLRKDAQGGSFKTKKASVVNKRHADELKLIKFVKKNNSSSTQSDSIYEDKTIKLQRRNAITAETEKEIKSTVYVRHSGSFVSSDKISVACEIHTEKPKSQAEAKRLRFEECPILIPSVDNDVTETNSVRRNVVLENDNPNLNSEIEEMKNSKDFMRFWSSRIKKGKK